MNERKKSELFGFVVAVVYVSVASGEVRLGVVVCGGRTGNGTVGGSYASSGSVGRGAAGRSSNNNGSGSIGILSRDCCVHRRTGEGDLNLR